MTEPEADQSEENQSATNQAEARIVRAAFGAANRARLINEYFDQQPNSGINLESAWAHVYRLLLWIDQTTGLGHCYESDKSQPGKRWYARSLAFHDWIAGALGTTPEGVAGEIDWLFLRAAENLAGEVVRRAERTTAKAAVQRKPYEGRGFPKPGEDPELINILRTSLAPHISSDPADDVWDLIVQRVRQYLALENKRKNLVGEGFEDVLAQIIQRTCRRADMQVHARQILQEIPGFKRSRAGDKPNKVDVSVVRSSIRTLITAKWSVRADREKQFVTDYQEYMDAESNGERFEYVFVTNEFDPARLARACAHLEKNHPMFTHVVHINTDAICATYALADDGKDESH